MENFPIFRKKVASAECSKSCNSSKKFFFCKFLKVENFPPKWKKFQFYPLGMKFGKREGLDAKNKISPKWKFFHQKWKIFDLCRMFHFMQFCKKRLFFLQIFESGKFTTKVEKFPISQLGMKFGKREGLDTQNKISPKWKIFHQNWKIFHLCRMFQFMQFCKKNFFFADFWKWKIFHLPTSLPTYLLIKKGSLILLKIGSDEVQDK